LIFDLRLAIGDSRFEVTHRSRCFAANTHSSLALGTELTANSMAAARKRKSKIKNQKSQMSCWAERYSLVFESSAWVRA
jgi:hypothetical protein